MDMGQKQYYGETFKAVALNDGDVFSVSSAAGCHEDGTPNRMRIKADLGNAVFSKFFEKAEMAILDYKKEEHTQRLEKIAPEVSLNLKIILAAFTAAANEQRRHNKFNVGQRNKLYNDAKNEPQTLSNIFKAQNLFCAEYSLLAKRFLDQQGVDSAFFSGSLMHEEYKETEETMPFVNTERHAFLVIKDQGDEYVYDPTNPVIVENGKEFYSLLKPVVPFSECETRMQQYELMIACDDVSVNRRFYYGVTDYGALNIHANCIVTSAKQKERTEPLTRENCHRVGLSPVQP
jgi:hypothetical protein